MAKVNSKISFVYVRDYSKFPVGCLAFTTAECNGCLCIVYGYSIYNPIDKFSKMAARNGAKNRLITQPLIYLFNKAPDEIHINDALGKIMLDIKANGNAYTGRKHRWLFDSSLDHTARHLFERISGLKDKKHINDVLAVIAMLSLEEQNEVKRLLTKE